VRNSQKCGQTKMTVTFVAPRTLIHDATVIPSVINIGGDYMTEIEQEDGLYDDVEMSEMDEHVGGSLLTKKLVVPGQLVTDDPQFMR